MVNIIYNIVNSTRKHFDKRHIFFIFILFAAIGIFTFFGFYSLKDSFYYKEIRSYSALVVFGLYFYSFFEPVRELSREKGYDALDTITGWAIISLVVFGICIYFFLLTGFNDGRLLNLPPALIALFGGLYGFYVNYQVNNRNQRNSQDEARRHQRSKAAFDIIMTTRTNAQLLDSLFNLRKVYPAGFKIPKEDFDYFSMTKHIEKPDLDKVAAMSGLKNLLNFHEYISVWISKGEIEEDFIYEVMGGQVIRLHEQALEVTKLQRQSDPAQGKHLEKLVSLWRARKANESLAVS